MNNVKNNPQKTQLLITIGWCAVLILVGFVVFHGYLNNGWIYDDEYLITGTDFYNQPFSPAALLMDLGDALTGKTMGYWRPGQLVLYKIEHTLFGLTPFYWHLVSLLLHIGACCALLILLRSIFGGSWAPGVIALLFLLHPVNSEVVGSNNYQISSAEGIFSFLALLAMKKRRGFLSAICVLCALSFRESALLLPLILTAFLPVFNSRIDKAAWARLAWPFGAVVIYFTLRQLVVANQMLQAPETFGLFSRIGLVAFLFAKTTLAPLAQNLCIYHEAVPTLLTTLIGWGVIALVVCIEIILVVRAARRKSDPLAAVFFGACLLTAAPYSGLVPPFRLFAEHYLFLPLAFFLAGLWALLRNVSHKRILAVVSLVLCACYGLVSYSRAGLFYNNETAFLDVVEKFPKSVTAHLSLGTYYFQKNKWGKSTEHYGQVVRITRGKNKTAWNNLGDIHFKSGNVEKAEYCFKNAKEKGQRNLVVLLLSQQRWDDLLHLAGDLAKQEPNDSFYQSALKKAQAEIK